jgi:hypothetical protein
MTRASLSGIFPKYSNMLTRAEAVSVRSTHLDSYYTEDAVLDVKGIVKQGKGPIDDLYKTTSPFPSS